MAAPISHDPTFWAAVKTLKKSQGTKLCLAASSADPCSGPIIAAHTIPKSQLQHIAESGHVCTLAGDLQIFQRTQGKLELVKKGIGTFSVLNCFCAHHDLALFSPIENHSLIFSPEQITCLHYRAIAAELYRKMTAAGGFEKTVSDYVKSQGVKDKPNLEEFAALYLHGTNLGIIDIGSTFKGCEEAMFKRQFEDVSGLVIEFQKPAGLMSVGGFSPNFDYSACRVQDLSNEAVRCDQISLSMLSSQGKAAVVFAWLKTASAPKLFVESLIKQRRDLYTTLIIQTAFEQLENTCMKIQWWDDLRPIERRLLTERMQEAMGPESRASTALTYGGVTFDDWGYENHYYVNV